jgi:hypothetical protein
MMPDTRMKSHEYSSKLLRAEVGRSKPPPRRGAPRTATL